MDWSFLDTYPIYLVSSHGGYDIDEIDEGGAPREFIVPPNVYIFEMGDIGENCMTHADDPTLHLTQGVNRKEFKEYFLKGTGRSEIKKSIFRNLTFYKPGDSIYMRYISMGENIRNMRETSLYENFGFFKFNVDDPAMEPDVARARGTILPALMHRLQSGGEDTDTNTKEVIDTVIGETPSPFPGGIFFMSSCGGHGCYKGMTPTCIRIMDIIGKRQRAQKLFLLSENVSGSTSVGKVRRGRQGVMGSSATPSGVNAGVTEDNKYMNIYMNNNSKAYTPAQLLKIKKARNAFTEGTAKRALEGFRAQMAAAHAAARQPLPPAKTAWQKCSGWLCGRGLKGGRKTRKVSRRKNTRTFTRK
jgi:hypothetical protein